jgi:hypothetical protein
LRTELATAGRGLCLRARGYQHFLTAYYYPTPNPNQGFRVSGRDGFSDGEKRIASWRPRLSGH